MTSSTDGPDQGDPAAWGVEVQRLRTELDDLRANPRDDHHTMTELYDYRLLYNAHAARGWLAQGIPVVRSWKHSDGEPCFGGGWFIVTATLPTGQVSNHYREDAWDLFAGVPEVDLPPEYDGHTPAVAADRLRDANRAPGAVAAAPPGDGHVLVDASDLRAVLALVETYDEGCLANTTPETARLAAALAAPPAGHEDEAAVERAALIAWGEDEHKGRLIAAAAADRFRDLVTEVLGYNENPGDDALVADLRTLHGKTGPESYRWRGFLSGQVTRLGPEDAERLNGDPS